MLDRTKLKRTGTKHIREVIDDDYARLLISTFLLLGGKWSTDSIPLTRLKIPWTHIGGKASISHYGRMHGVMFKSANNMWRINTKRAHEFLYYWSHQHEDN